MDERSEAILRDQRARAYGAGYMARANFGKDISANPHIGNGREDLRISWRQGWYAAENAA